MRKITAAAAAALAVLALVQPAGASNDPLFAQQWNIGRIHAEQAWAVADGTGTLVAIVDTGVDLGHPDLASKIVYFPEADFVEPGGTCSGPKKTRTCTQDGPQDRNGHGTHVAGIAAAITGNGVGVAGVAPGAQILPVRVLDANGAGTSEQITAGIRFAADKGADVINLSLGYLSGVDQIAKLQGDVQPIHDAIEYAWGKGAVIVIAAGNDSYPLCAEPAPAPHAVCVGATDRNDLRSYYSNSDASMTRPYVVAPGGQGTFCADEVLSTYLRTAERFCSDVVGYDAIAGTSMAAPHVSGIAALLAGKGLTNQQIVACLVSTSVDLGPPGRDPIFGYGRVDALAAVSSC